MTTFRLRRAPERRLALPRRAPHGLLLAFARTLGLANATFWRHYHDIATELRHHDAGARQSVPALDQNQCPGQAGELASQNAALRRERDHLASQLEAAPSHLRRLTIDNAELRSELETARAITRIGRPDTASQPRLTVCSARHTGASELRGV